MAALRVPKTTASYQRELSIQLENNPVSVSVENAWNNLAQSLHKAAEKAVGATTKKNNPWISGETLKLILDRNDATSKKQDASTIKEKRKAVNRFLLSKIKDIELAEARGD